MAAAVIAILLSLGSFVFALLVWSDSQRARQDHDRAVALSATHTARLLLDEAVEIQARTDALVEAAGLAMGDDARRRYDDVRRAVAADRDKVERAMADLAFGTPSSVECRAIAAASTLTTQRTIAGRREILDVLRALRGQVGPPLAPAGDGAIDPAPVRARAEPRS